MVETRGTRGGRRGRAPRGRGRRGGRGTFAESETRIPVQEDVIVEDPVQQPLPTDRAGFVEMMREVVRGMVVTPQTDSGSVPVAQTDPAPVGPPPIAPTLTAEVRSEGHVDWVKAVGQCRPPFFYGARDRR